jgi:hypothetical protein
MKDMSIEDPTAPADTEDINQLAQRLGLSVNQAQAAQAQSQLVNRQAQETRLAAIQRSKQAGATAPASGDTRAAWGR